MEFGTMAGVEMPDWAIERATGRRGTAHPFADLTPQTTALVVIDLQVGFMHERGGYMACAAAIDVVPNVNRLAGALRDAGGLVAWVQNTHDESCLRLDRAAADEHRRGERAPQRRHERRRAGPRAVARARRAARGRGRAQAPLQRLHPRHLRPGTHAARPRHRHRSDRRHADQRLLRKLRPRRHDARLPHGHGQRRLRDHFGRGAQRLARRVLRHVRRRAWTPSSSSRAWRREQARAA